MDLLAARSAVIDSGQLWGYAVKLPVIAFVVLGGWLAIRHLKALMAHLLGRTGAEGVIFRIVLVLLRLIGWTVVVTSVFSILGLGEISLALSGSIALMALAASQGLSSVVNDWISGLFLGSDCDLRTGRRIRVGRIEGTLISVGFRKTRIRDARGDVHVVPNKSIDGSVYIIRRDRNDFQGPRP